MSDKVGRTKNSAKKTRIERRIPKKNKLEYDNFFASYDRLVREAIEDLMTTETHGVTRPAIVQWIWSKYKSSEKKKSVETSVKNALKKGLKNNTLLVKNRSEVQKDREQ